MKIKKQEYANFSASQIIVIGFAVVIIVGAILLMLPISSRNGEITPFVDSIFTSTSAVCVTGLTVVNTAQHWSYFGKMVIILLIQIGGIGFMSFATLFAIAVGKRIGLKERIIIKESVNGNNIQGIVRLSKYIIGFTFLIEFIGAVLLSTQLIPKYGFKTGTAYSFFHSISAFCNAGFDLFGDSLVSFNTNPVLIMTISLLVVVGGLGFSVWAEIYNYKILKKLSLHSKVVLITTGILISFGTILFFILEYNNNKTIGNMSIINKISNSIFAAITPRTAGFNSINLTSMRESSIFLTILLMFIGAAPGSTGGGIKVSTFAIIMFALYASVRGRQENNIMKRRINITVVLRAFLVFFLGLFIIIIAVFLLRISSESIVFEKILFEATSAFGTVGLSLDLTPSLNTLGRIVIIVVMFAGRVGGLTILFAVGAERKKAMIRYPEGKILVG